MANYKNVAGAAVFCATAVLCTQFEGVRTTAYHDTLANGLPTVCIGETIGVKMGDRYSAEQCRDMLAKRLPDYWDAINKCIHVRISNNEKVAYTDFAYNVGSGAFCGSSLLKKLNAEDHKGACNGLMVWNRTKSAGAVRGLTRRRDAERAICLTPDSHKVIATVDDHISKKPLPPHVPVCSGWWLWKVCK